MRIVWFLFCGQRSGIVDFGLQVLNEEIVGLGFKFFPSHLLLNSSSLTSILLESLSTGQCPRSQGVMSQMDGEGLCMHSKQYMSLKKPFPRFLDSMSMMMEILSPICYGGSTHANHFSKCVLQREPCSCLAMVTPGIIGLSKSCLLCGQPAFSYIVFHIWH